MVMDTGSKVLYPSFNSPLPLPAQDPDGEPTISVTVACSWLPYIRGALYQLTQQWSWPQDSAAELALAQARAQTLIAMFEECDDTIPPIACGYNFTVSNAGWEAISPYTSFGYNPGFGWVGQFFDANSKNFVFISHPLTGVNKITHIEFQLTADANGSGANNVVHIEIATATTDVYVTTETVTEGTRVYTWDGEVDNVTLISLRVNSGDSDNVLVLTHAYYRGLSDSGCE